jgi:PadR family transcriptional regulator, regulatory protein AphA
MREAATRYVLLGAIDALKAASGYEIKQLIQLAIGNFWNESFGQIYPALKDLAGEGLIAATDEDIGPREQRRFKITDAGREALSAWVRKPPYPDRPRSELLLKLFFGKFADPDWARDALTAARDQYGKAQKIAAMGFDQTLSEDAADPSLVYYLIVADAGRTIQAARKQWAEHALKMLDAFERGGNAAVIALVTDENSKL